MTKRYHDDHLLWDAAIVLVRSDCPDLAVPVLRKAIESSFSVIDQSIEFLNEVTLKIPSDEQIRSLKAYDSAIKQAVKNGNFDEAGDRYDQYFDALQDIFEGYGNQEIKKKLFGKLLKTSYESQYTSGLVNEQAAVYTTAERTAYTTSEAAEIINVSDQTIRRMCENGKFPDAYKTEGGHWRVPAKYFRISLEQARKRKQNIKPLIEKAKKGGDVDEFNLI